MISYDPPRASRPDAPRGTNSTTPSSAHPQPASKATPSLGHSGLVAKVVPSATFEPRLRLMFAVRVLEQSMVERETGHRKGHHRRETCMGVRNLLRKEEAVARHGACGIEVRFREHARSAEAGVGRHGERDLIRLEVLAREGPPARGRRGTGLSMKGEGGGAGEKILTGSACCSPRRGDRGSRPCMGIQAWTRA